MDIKTPSGFSCKISEDVRDDMELLDDLTAVDRGDLSHMPDVIRSRPSLWARETLKPATAPMRRRASVIL